MMMQLFRSTIAAICCSLVSPAIAEEMWKGKVYGVWFEGYRIEETANDQSVIWFRACPVYNLDDQPFDRVEAIASPREDCPELPDERRKGPFDGTLRTVNESGAIKCGVSLGTPGFADTGPDGEWAGMNVSICRALAAAVLGDPAMVKFVPISPKMRFAALSTGEVDVLIPNEPWTMGSDTALTFEFVGINYYGGLRLLVDKDLGVQSARELDNKVVCVSSLDQDVRLAEYFRDLGMQVKVYQAPSALEAQEYYLAGACEALVGEASELAILRATFEEPSKHTILPDAISKEAIGTYVREGDERWADVVRGTVNALIVAEELGINQGNVWALAEGSDEPAIARLLGSQDELGSLLGLDRRWAARAIASVGNYGEIFERTLGTGTALNLSRSMNSLWNQGGAIYGSPFR